MSLLSVCYLVPEVLLNFISGSISDRWNKKKIMLAADSIAALFSLSVLMMLLTGSLRIEYLYIINFMLGVADSFQSPASDVAVSAIVSKENYMKTSGIRTFCESFIGILAPVAATSLYALLGLKIIVLIDLLTFLFAVNTLAFAVKIPHTPRPEGQKTSLLKECQAGIRFLLQKKNVMSLIMFMAFVNLIAAVYNTSLAPMVLSRNGNNDIQLGIVSSSISIAGLVGSLLVTRIPNKSKRATLILNIMTFSFLICNGLLGLGRNVYVWTFAVFAGNLFIPLLSANVEYIMRTRVPFELQGKVFSARNTLQYTSIPIGNLLSGVLADEVFVPYMKKPSGFQAFWSVIVGKSNGSGLALMYLGIAVIGVIGCFIFRKNKNMLLLDKE
jgi:MFS family permease